MLLCTGLRGKSLLGCENESIPPLAIANFATWQRVLCPTMSICFRASNIASSVSATSFIPPITEKPGASPRLWSSFRSIKTVAILRLRGRRRRRRRPSLAALAGRIFCCELNPSYNCNCGWLQWESIPQVQCPSVAEPSPHLTLIPLA